MPMVMMPMVLVFINNVPVRVWKILL